MKAIKKIKLNEFRVMSDSEMKGVTGGYLDQYYMPIEPSNSCGGEFCIGEKCEITYTPFEKISGTCKGVQGGACGCVPDRDIFNPR